MLSLVLMLRKSMNSWYGLTCTLLLHASGCCNAFQPVASKISARCHPSRTPASAIGTGSFIHHARTQAQRSWLQPLTIHPYSRSFVVEQLGAVADDFHTESESSSFLVRQSVPATTPADASLLTTRLHPFTQILKRALSKMFSWKSYLGLNSFRRKLATVALAMVLLVFNASSAWAVTGGRMGGGSFKSSPSRSSSGGGGMGRTSTLSRPSPSGRVYFPPPSRIIRHHHYGPSAPIIVNSFSDSRGFYAPTPAIVNTRIMTKDILVLTGTGVLLVYAFRNNYRRNNDYGDVGPLGPGTTVGSVTVALDVPNRSDPENILSKLSRMSMTADTTSKQGLQDLLSAVALELLRQEKAITSAYARSNHYTITGQAEREFQMLSVQSQSKVDRLIGMYQIIVPAPQFSGSQV